MSAVLVTKRYVEGCVFERAFGVFEVHLPLAGAQVEAVLRERVLSE